MGIDIPVDAVKLVLHDQDDWNKRRVRRSLKAHLQKRYALYISANETALTLDLYRNLEKKKKGERYEKEKALMETLRGLGSAVGEYVGGGQGEPEGDETAVNFDLVDADGGDDQLMSGDEDRDNDDAHPLLILYDCETTGLSIYNDHITDIAGKVITSPVPLDKPTFSSLVKTSRRIPVAGLLPIYIETLCIY